MSNYPASEHPNLRENKHQYFMQGYKKQREPGPGPYRRAEAEELYKTGARGGCSRRCGRGCSRRMEQRRSSRGRRRKEKEEGRKEEGADG